MKTFTFIKGVAQTACFDNQLSAYNPQLWAMEAVALTVENLVAANLVNRDYESQVQSFGDVVNTRQPASFDAIRKTNADSVTDQDAVSTNIQIPLDQWPHVTFIIKDGERSKSFQDLVRIFIQPAAQSLARQVDRIVLGQYAQFIQNQAGTLGGLSNSNGVQYITETRGVLNRNKAPDDKQRQFVWGTDAETILLQNPTFVQANTAGDGGVTQRTGFLGDKFGFQNYQAQNMAQLNSDSTTGAGQINNGNITKGSTVLTVDNFASGEVVAGQWISINGKVYHVTATNNATATTLTLEYGLLANVANDDNIVVYDKANVTATYAAGYIKGIVIDDGAGANPATTLQVGQLVTFGTDNTRYTVLKVTVGSTTTTIELDRPLASSVTSSTAINYGPQGGGFNFAFHRDALTLAIRPLALPDAGLGANSGFAEYAGVAMRVVMTYDGKAQGIRVTMDFLAGIKVLDDDLGAVCLT